MFREPICIRVVVLKCLFLLVCIPGVSVSDTRSTTQSLDAQIDPIGKVSVLASLPLTHSGSTFQPYSGVLPVSYRVRTSAAGSGTITLQATADFSPSGGPSVVSGGLTYTCSGSTLGTACSGTHTVSTTAQTPVLNIPSGVCTGGGGACSSPDPNSMSVTFNLTNSPQHKTGTFAASLTLTISAT